MHSATPRPPLVTRSTWVVAAIGMAIQAMLVLACVVWLVVSAASGSSSDTGRAITEAVTIAVFGVGAVALSVALWRERSAARTPTLVWDGFVVFCGGFLARSGAPTLGIALVVFGLLAFLATLRVPALQDTPDGEADAT